MRLMRLCTWVWDETKNKKEGGQRTPRQSPNEEEYGGQAVDEDSHWPDEKFRSEAIHL